MMKMRQFDVKLVVYFLLFMASGYCMDNDDASIQLNDDVLGLIVFKSELKDPSAFLESWNEDDNSPCSWRFIQCNPLNGRVSQVSLDSLGLSGKIGRGLQKLQHLKVLSLSHNNFSGNISPELGLISSLERLNLSFNSLSGLIPSTLVNSTSIKFLDLSENSLSGPLPDDLFAECLSLRYLSLAGNNLEGPLSSSLSRCSSLNTLNLSANHFSGEPDFASRIWSLKRLRTLDLSNNAFSGSIPEGVLILHNLKELQLKGNKFSGPLPKDIGFCPHLNRLDLSNNLLIGELPESFGMLNALSFINVSSNMLRGDLPQWIGNISSLEFVDFSNNGLTGSLPSSMANLKSLKYLSLSNNKLTGKIPSSFAECTKLSVISLRGNSFNGSMPEGLFNLGLEVVDFSENELMGTIPPGSSKLFESLQILDLSSNNLAGSIPAEMGLFANLRYLNLSWNHLHSRIPPELGYFQNLTELDLRNNDLYGSIPEDICESASLGILQLDGNSLAGPIPEEIGNCSSLYLLSFSHNNLSGSIPKSISKLNKLKILKLEFNELSGEIPQELGKLENLLAVNVSYNRLIGRLPVAGVFPTLDQSALQGNLGLCSPLLKGPCKMNVPKPLVLNPNEYTDQTDGHRPRTESSNQKSGRHMFLTVSAIVAISAAAIIAFGVVVISLLNVSARRKLAFVDTALESMCSSSSKSGSISAGKLVLFDTRSSPDWIISNPEAILKKAAEIGEGVFGTVYRIPLGTQGRIVAIKKLVTPNIIQHPEDFEREVRVLGKARHPNLISLEGYYWTPQLQLLVSDYAPNGSLQAKLHERLPSTPPLSWADRFKVILGTAKGLAHLHHSFRPPIIHYNIKPSNILLDDNLNPKISDFGLARLLTKLDKHVMSNRFQSAVGYVAPELTCQSLRVNEKCDVYGFGVLILEVVTGRRAVEYGEDNVVILSDHVRVMLEQGNASECVDSGMGEYPEDEVLPVLKLALVCTSQVPSSRPSMDEILQILQVIKTALPERMEMF
ncbi:probably inactive leucine-rich repeat receptor-like protein kinase At3g28040 [Mangifera indica]|uniref:probably inactive leucine-rich repeat receptor-like protein kinase At3g28040 n=1 Tax=Mangifera indica TaxID=29780 RepID=UPI001CFA332F|nr:probably inactive leucine-rich repeat receptor-like protein kinase At3g28040 [Mangifera indica]